MIEPRHGYELQEIIHAVHAAGGIPSHEGVHDGRTRVCVEVELDAGTEKISRYVCHVEFETDYIRAYTETAGQNNLDLEKLALYLRTVVARARNVSRAGMDALLLARDLTRLDFMVAVNQTNEHDPTLHAWRSQGDSVYMQYTCVGYEIHYGRTKNYGIARRAQGLAREEVVLWLRGFYA